MKLKRCTYSELANEVRKNNIRIIIYGAGMIGQIVVPYIVETYRLHDYVDCYEIGRASCRERVCAYV